MAAEAGHAPSRTYRGQDGAFYLNGAAFYNDAGDDISASLEQLNSLAPAEIAFIDGVTAGTAAASKALVLDANKDITYPEASDWAFGTTTGTKIGTATSQKLGFWNATPVVQPTALTAQLTTITPADAEGTPDYAIQAITNSTPFGFVNAQECITLLYVVKNLQTRLAEVEARLEATGLVAAN